MLLRLLAEPCLAAMRLHHAVYRASNSQRVSLADERVVNCGWLTTNTYGTRLVNAKPQILAGREIVIDFLFRSKCFKW